MSLKILVAGDFHAREDLLEGARSELENGDYDLFVNVGDYMDLEYAERLFKDLDTAAVGCTGNRDLHIMEEDLKGLPIYHFLDADIDDEYKLVLIGGDFPEDVKEQLEEILEEVDKNKLIVGSHYPPKKVGDKIASGQRIGFEQFRELLIKFKPAAWFNGHVHEDYGERELMGTKVLNASSYDTGKAFEVVIGEEGLQSVKEIDLLH